MKAFVNDTNSLLQILPRRSRYNYIWQDFLEERFTLCVSTEILNEYEEILSTHISPTVAENIISTIVNQENTLLITPYYYFGLILSAPDDNKFVDCAICANASYIVTEDRHFDILSRIDYPKVEVVNLDKYASVMR